MELIDPELEPIIENDQTKLFRRQCAACTYLLINNSGPAQLLIEAPKFTSKERREQYADLIKRMRSADLQLNVLECAAVRNIQEDVKSKQIYERIKSMESLEAFFEEVKRSTSEFDLSSYDFEKDPDCSWNPFQAKLM